MREVPRNARLNEIRAAAAPNLFDRVVSWVDPVRGQRRMQARYAMALAGGYIGGKKDRRATRNWPAGNNSADEDILPDLEMLRYRCRDLSRNDPIALGAVSTNVSNVVGTGLDLSCRIDYETLGWKIDQAVAWQKNTERRFRMWASSKNCDITRTQNFYDLQALAHRAVLDSGDALAVLPMKAVKGFPFETRIQIVEADRLSNPSRKSDTETLTAGVETDADGAPVAYHVSKQHPGAPNFKNDATNWTRIPAFGETTGRRNVLHMFDRLRPGQTRGVPYLAPVIENLKLLGRFTEAELNATVVSACFSVFIKSEAGETVTVNTDESPTPSTSNARSTMKLEPALVTELNPGESIESATPGRPNGAFDPFVQAILRQIGVALEIPFELLIKHFTASYSASLAAVQLAWQFFRRRREWLAGSFCQPCYEAWMDEQVASGAISAPGYFADPLIRAAYLNAEWIGDAQIQLDPAKAVEAAEKRMNIGLSTLEQETIADSGRSWEENLAQRQREMEAHKAAKVPYLTSQAAQQQAPSGPAKGTPDTQDPQDPQDPNEGREA